VTHAHIRRESEREREREREREKRERDEPGLVWLATGSSSYINLQKACARAYALERERESERDAYRIIGVQQVFGQWAWIRLQLGAHNEKILFVGWNSCKAMKAQTVRGTRERERESETFALKDALFESADKVSGAHHKGEGEARQ
jgi:hypothetical protein